MFDNRELFFILAFVKWLSYTGKSLIFGTAILKDGMYISASR
jgi:hypothetical protein